MLIFHIIYHHLLIAMGKDLVFPAALKSDVCFLSLIPLILRPGVGVDHLPCSSLLLAECSPFSLSKTLHLKLLAAEHAVLLCVAVPLPGTTLISYPWLTVVFLPWHLSKSCMISASIDDLNALAFQFLDLSSNKPSSLLPIIFICFTCPISWLSMAPKLGILIFWDKSIIFFCGLLQSNI